MKSVALLLLLTGALLFNAATCTAATYYVDFSEGSDTNNGIGTGTPFKHCPGDSSATGTASSTNLAAGNIVQFKGGVTYTGTVTINSSGSSGNPITYDGNSAGSWGAGKAIIDLKAANYHAFNSNTAHNYITITNFDIKNAKNTNANQNQTVERGGVTVTGVNYGGDGLVSSQGAIRNYGGSNWVIQNCFIHEFENWSDRSVQNAEGDNNTLTPARVPCEQIGILFSASATNCRVSNCELWAVGHTCIAINTTSSGFNISDCNFGGSSAGAATGYFNEALRLGIGSANVTVSRCVFHDGWQYEGDDDGGKRSHAGDWIHMYGNNNGTFEPGSDANNILIERCFFYNNKTFRNAYSTSVIYAEQDARDIKIRNNIMVNSHHMSIWVNKAAEITVTNNTIITYGRAASGGATPFFFGVGAGRTTLRNNILVTYSSNSAVMPLTLAGTDAIDSDYNLFYNPNNITGHGSIKRGGVTYTLANWQQSFQNDIHSSVGDPKLASLPEAALSGTGNYRPTADSTSVLGKGTLMDAGLDYAGATLPAIAPWDLGAYQGSSRTLTSPSNLRVVR